MTKLSVNINKIATLRNARGKDIPNVLDAALAIEGFGAHGITVHPRPDGRHIRFDDVKELRQHLKVELNIEGYPSPDFMALIEQIRPAQCTLVPDPPHVLTSNAGWRVAANEKLIGKTIEQLHQWQVRSSFFVEPGQISSAELELLRDMGAHRVELYTEFYAENFPRNPELAIQPYRELAAQASVVGLGLNAGHDLNQANLGYFAKNIPYLLEVSIGHALIAEALYDGLSTTIANYLKCLEV